MNYREELFKALTAGVDGVFRDKSIDALVEVCRAARKEGYKSGYQDGCNDKQHDLECDYAKGLADAWECARSVINNEVPFEFWNLASGQSNLEVFKHYSATGAIDKIKEYEEKQKEPVFKIGDRVETLVAKDSLGTEIFPVGTIGEVVGINGNSIAVQADVATGCYGYYHADALELANDVIIVGDEVYLLDANYHGVVTAVWEVGGVVKTERLTQSGKLACDDAKDLHRTGRRFPEIANVLKKMQEGNE